MKLNSKLFFKCLPFGFLCGFFLCYLPNFAQKVSTPTIEFASDYLFKNKKTIFEPGEDVFVRLLTPKPIGDMFKDVFKLDGIPMSGNMVIAIGKNADDENPIVATVYTCFPRNKN